MYKKTTINLVLALTMLLPLGMSAVSAAPPAQEELTYTVKLGDNLWTLAEKYLGSGPAYLAIVGATNAKHEVDSSFAYIENPDLIHPGWKLLIPPPKARGFSIYLLADEIPATELLPVDLKDLKLQEEPILSSDDIITYSKKTHEIEVTAAAYETIQQLFSLPAKVRGIPFVVCVGPDRVYAGAFWTPVSSLSFDGVIIICQPFDPDQHVIRIGLGYPTCEAFTGEDPRSDQRILQSLEAAGKLK